MRYPVVVGGIGLAINLLIPEEVNQAMIGSGIPAFQELSGIRQGEIRFLSMIKNAAINNQLTKKAAGLLYNRTGKAFEEFAARVLFPGADKQVPVARRVIDFVWRGRAIELKTSTTLDARELDQLNKFAAYAKRESKTLVYFFLTKPTPSTTQKINAAGGAVMYFYEN